MLIFVSLDLIVMHVYMNNQDSGAQSMYHKNDLKVGVDFCKVTIDMA